MLNYFKSEILHRIILCQVRTENNDQNIFSSNRFYSIYIYIYYKIKSIKIGNPISVCTLFSWIIVYSLTIFRKEKL